MPKARPNIVLFLADDYSWHDSAPYGSTNTRTPNLDAMARQGMTFNSAFCASPTCTPSRSAIFTGLYPFRNGAHANHSLINDDVQTLPAYMQKLGYRTVLAGKTHIGPRSSFAFEFLPNSNVMPAGKNHVLWTDLNTKAVDGLLATHDKSKPLCLIVASHSPHVYWPPIKGFDPAKVQLPPYLLDTPETRKALCRYYTDVEHMDEQLGDVLASLEKHGYAENSLVMFSADQGAQFPLAKWNLYDAGIRTPLVVKWPGHVKGESTTRAMVSLIDLLPTMIEAGGGESPKDLDAKSFLSVLNDPARSHREDVFAAHTGDGQMNRSPTRCIRTQRYKLIVNLLPGNEFRTHISHAAGADGKDYWDSWVERAKTDPRAAQMVDRVLHRPSEELYDVVADPYELNNLASDPAHAKTLAELRSKLDEWRVQQGEDLKKIPMPEDSRHGEIPYAQ